MTGTAHFTVDTRLAVLLGETYRSSEQALKELVDNAWDADADRVEITLPAPMTDDPILFEDNGSGMTTKEVAGEYLAVANDRRTRKGETTPKLHRKVKGRKGIGKFAGLMVAARMELSTRARGVETAFELVKQDLTGIGTDLERIPLDLQTRPCETEAQGTRIRLSGLNQNLRFPDADRLRALLMQEYGREQGFEILVDGKPLGVEDLPGPTTEERADLPGVGAVRTRFTVSERRQGLKNPGIVVKVGGKVIGRPQFFGLDEADDFPPKLLKKVWGEVDADSLVDDVTADWGAIVENSKGYQALVEWLAPIVRRQVTEVYAREMQLALARIKKAADERLARLPEFKRQFADRALKKVLHRFYDEPEERLKPMVSVLLDALENDDYRLVIKAIDEASRADLATFAEALEEFGLLELALVGRQVNRRLAFIDHLETLIANLQTDEKTVHQAMEHSLWLFGAEYSLMASNRTLKGIVEQLLNRQYQGERQLERPDLLLSQAVSGALLLIEFKRPAATVGLEAYQQASRYRHELDRHSHEPIEIIVVGGRRGEDIPQRYTEESVTITSYAAILSKARRQLEWMREHLVRDG